MESVLPNLTGQDLEREGGIAALLAVVARSLLPQPVLTDVEAQVLNLIEFAGSRFGAQLLAATDQDDLEDRLDAILESPDFHQTQTLMMEVMGPLISGGAPVSATQTVRTASLLEEAFGAGAAPIVREAVRYANACAALLLQAKEIEGVDEAAIATGGQSPLAFVSAPQMPTRIVRALIGGQRANVTLYAAVHMLLSFTRPEPWLRLAIAERWRDGLKLFLPALAMVFDAELPTDVAPLSKADLEARSNRIAAAYKSAAEKAHASGEPVFPPGE